MKLLFFLYGLTALTIVSCTTSKNVSSSKGETKDAIQNAIDDFLQSKRSLLRENSVFSIFVENINNDVLGIGISGEKDKVALFTKNEVDYDYRFFPTRIYEQKGKIFLWKDSTISVPKEVISRLYALNKVDTTIYQKKFPERTIDEKQMVTHYYFCKKDLTGYQKKRTSIAMNKYEVPTIKCNGK